MPKLGTRKLYYLLQPFLENQSIKMGRDALFKYLKSEHLLISPKRNYTKTTDSKHWLRKYPNLLIDRKIENPEEVFVSDITYVKSREKTHYLTLITDAYSRKIMGFKLSNNMSTENVVQALEMAIKNKITNNQTIHHSDRGLQYCSQLYQDKLRNAGMFPSMTDGYDCYQNALAERMNGIIKNEFLIHLCNTKNELNTMIKESIFIYNNKRPHLSLDMKTPEQRHKKPEVIL